MALEELKYTILQEEVKNENSFNMDNDGKMTGFWTCYQQAKWCVDNCTNPSVTFKILTITQDNRQAMLGAQGPQEEIMKELLDLGYDCGEDTATGGC